VGRPNERRLPSDIETTIYRLAQEALNNVVKHARADRVDIVLEYVADSVRLVIEDNGVGFNVSDAEASATGLGLIGMRERAALAGADLRIESSPGHGTTVSLRVPVEAISRSA
jgi:signal transduction histidine kinase